MCIVRRHVHRLAKPISVCIGNKSKSLDKKKKKKENCNSRRIAIYLSSQSVSQSVE